MSIDIEWLKQHHNISDDQIRRRKTFLDDLETLMRKHDVSISHEDGHGAFELEDFDENNLAWIRHAHYGAYE